MNCALWSNEVYETRDGGLVNIPQICKRAQDTVSKVVDIQLFISLLLSYLLTTFLSLWFVCLIHPTDNSSSVLISSSSLLISSSSPSKLEESQLLEPYFQSRTVKTHDIHIVCVCVILK